MGPGGPPHQVSSPGGVFFMFLMSVLADMVADMVLKTRKGVKKSGSGTLDQSFYESRFFACPVVSTF